MLACWQVGIAIKKRREEIDSDTTLIHIRDSQGGNQVGHRLAEPPGLCNIVRQPARFSRAIWLRLQRHSEALPGTRTAAEDFLDLPKPRSPWRRSPFAAISAECLCVRDDLAYIHTGQLIPAVALCHTNTSSRFARLVLATELPSN